MCDFAHDICQISVVQVLEERAVLNPYSKSFLATLLYRFAMLGIPTFSSVWIASLYRSPDTGSWSSHLLSD
jgi:hypothetical protein